MTNWKNLKEADRSDLLRLSAKALDYYENTDERLFVQPDGLYSYGMDAQSLCREDMTLADVESLFCELCDAESRKWYAVQRESSDAWDNGSYDYNEAVEMLKEQGCGLIAVINEGTSFCEDEIYFEDLL